MTTNNPAPIVITMHGSTVARCAQFDAEVEKKRGSVLCDLARRLIALGADPDAPAQVQRNGTLCFVPVPLKTWAKLTVVENDQTSARLASFQPYSGPEHAQSATASAPRTPLGALQVQP